MGLALKQGRTVAGFETIPFMGPDGVADLGPGGTEGATITVAGSAAHDVHGTVAGVHDLPGGSTFVADYTAEFGKAPGAYSAIAYACAQVIIANAAKAIAAGTTDPAALREAVRAAATAAGNAYDTVIGTCQLRQERRHHDAVHVVLQDRPDRRRRQGRLGVREAAGLHRPEQVGSLHVRGRGAPLPGLALTLAQSLTVQSAMRPDRRRALRIRGDRRRSLLVLGYVVLGVQQFQNFLTLGAIYALIALGYTMVYGIIELINFAHGDVFMVGAFLRCGS